MLWANFSVRSQRGNIFSFVRHRVSVTATHLCCNVEELIDDT